MVHLTLNLSPAKGNNSEVEKVRKLVGICQMKRLEKYGILREQASIYTITTVQYKQLRRIKRKQVLLDGAKQITEYVKAYNLEEAFLCGGIEKYRSRMIDGQAQHMFGSINGAARALKMPAGTIVTWQRTNEDFRKLIELFTDALIDELKVKVVHIAQEAIEVERGIMLDTLNDPKIRLSAAQDILNRIPKLATKEEKSGQNTAAINVVNYFDGVADKALAEIIELENTAKVVEQDDRTSVGGEDTISEGGKAPQNSA